MAIGRKNSEKRQCADFGTSQSSKMPSGLLSRADFGTKMISRFQRFYKALKLLLNKSLKNAPVSSVLPTYQQIVFEIKLGEARGQNLQPDN